jgi:alpha-beta hydrolase superfamily lysophospholipase
VHGEADASASIEGSRRLAAAAAVGTISLITFPGGFHELHNEPEETGVPQRFVETVLAFAGGQAPGVRAPASRDSASSSTS